ncbi:MAG: alginate O-acetyltransferase AlgX-related protein [Lachnospiraceae bacterium]
MEKGRGSGNKGRKIIRRISIALFLCVLILPQVSWTVLKLVCGDNSRVMERLDYDLGENRELAAFPDDADIGSITSELEAYYNDHAPYRSALITINRRINSKLERAYTMNVQPVLVALADMTHTATKPDVSVTESSTEGQNDTENSTRYAQEDNTGENSAIKDNIEDNNADDKNGGNSGVGNGENSTSDGNGSISGGIDSEYSSGVSGDSGNGNADGETLDDINSGQKPGNGKNESGEMSSNDGGANESGGTSENNGSADSSDKLPYFPAREMNGTIFGRDDWMFCNYDNSIAYYCGSNLMSEQQMKDKLSLMQKLQNICDSRGVQLQFMIAPNKEQVYSEYMPTYTIENSYKRVPEFIDYVKRNSSVKIIYPIDELRAAKSTMSTYYKYDTHWNHYGSFIATQALYKDMGLDYVSPDSVNYSEGSCIWGLVITAGLSWKDYERDYDHIPDYKPEIELFNTDGEIDHIHTEKSAVYRTDSTASNQSRFVMVGDSFRLYMMPYLERDFQHVSIAHRDNIHDIEDDIRQADILVVECVERLDDSLNGTILQLIDILENQGKSN